MATTQNTYDIFSWTQPPAKPDGPDYVYFIQNKKADLIKIGRSWKPALRLQQLQRVNPNSLALEATIEVSGSYNSASLEKHLHNYFAETRVEGEWFLPSDDLLNLIEDAKLERINIGRGHL